MRSRSERLEYARSHYESNSYVYKKRALQNSRRARRELREVVSRYLSEHPCVDCGEKDILVLQFDHVRGVKEANVTDLVRAACSFRTVMREIEKCDIRCANCHQRRTTIARRSREKTAARLIPVDPQSRLEGL